MPSSTVFRTMTCLALIAALLAALAIGLLGFPSTATAATAGPFNVSGPESSYSWDGSTLTISGNDVAITGMSSPDAPAGAVVVNENVKTVGIGTNVRIGTLTVKRSTTFVVSGKGNEIVRLDTARDDAVGGDGKVTIETSERGVDVYDSAVVRVDGEISGAYVWQRATLVLGPQAKVTGPITALGGTLDLSQVVIGQPIPVYGVSVGSEATLALAAPFGATDLHQLLDYQGNNLVINDPTPVYEDGEDIGTLNKDGSFNITATREVTFVGFDGAPLATETVRLFGAATAPEVTAPDGYRFTGWNRAFDYVTENMTVAARFEEIPAPEPTPTPTPEPRPEPQPQPPAPDGGTTPSGAATGTTPVKGSAYAPARAALAATGDDVAPLAAAAAMAGALASGAAAAGAAALRRS